MRLTVVMTAVTLGWAVTDAANAPKQSASGVDDEARRLLMSVCEQKSNKCKGQNPEYSRTRRIIKNILINDFRVRQPSLSHAAASRLAEDRLIRIHNLKTKLNMKSGLGDIHPADNGLWQGDVILTEEQIDYINETLDNPVEISLSPEDHGKSRSAAMYFEKNARARWSMPIRYWISNQFTREEEGTIDDALGTLAQASGCIRFQKEGNKAGSGSQMQFVKPGTGCYGYSYIGHVGINPVNVATTNWCRGDILKGLVMHEVIHALGGGHEQSRKDRNYYIDILWDNIDPQQWSQYQIAQWSTSYGVPYDYRSIMHYHNGAFAKRQGLQTMRPKANTQLGGNSLTSNDILQLQRMYCKDANCVDKYQDCGTWAVFKYCNDAKWGQLMKVHCAKSCGVC